MASPLQHQTGPMSRPARFGATAFAMAALALTLLVVWAASSLADHVRFTSALGPDPVASVSTGSEGSRSEPSRLSRTRLPRRALREASPPPRPSRHLSHFPTLPPRDHYRLNLTAGTGNSEATAGACRVDTPVADARGSFPTYPRPRGTGRNHPML